MDEAIKNELKIKINLSFNTEIDNTKKNSILEEIDNSKKYTTKSTTFNLKNRMLKFFNYNELEMYLAKFDLDEDIYLLNEIKININMDSIHSEENNINISDLSNIKDIIQMIDKIVENEINEKLNKTSENWSFKSFSNVFKKNTSESNSGWGIKNISGIFKSNPEKDKIRADALFLSKNYKEAYKLYYKNKGNSTISHYCIEMAIYCLVILKKTITVDFLEKIKNLKFEESMYFCRLLIVLLLCEQEYTFFRIFELLHNSNILKPLILVESVKYLKNKEAYSRKLASTAFIVSFSLYQNKCYDKAIGSMSIFLNHLYNICEKNENNKNDIVFLEDSFEYLKNLYFKIKELNESSSVENLINKIEKFLSKKKINSVKLFRSINTSNALLKDTMNIKETLNLESNTKILINAIKLNNSVNSYDEFVISSSSPYHFKTPGSYALKNYIYYSGGIKKMAPLNQNILITEDAPYLHIEVDDEHEVYSNQVYTLQANIIRNFNENYKVTINGKIFFYDKNQINLSLLFLFPKLTEIKLCVEGAGIYIEKKLSFVVKPLVSVDIYHNKLIIPLVYLKFTNLTDKYIKIKNVNIKNGEVDVCDVKNTDDFAMTENDMIEYFKENILGVSQEFIDIEQKKNYDENSDVFSWINKSPPTSTELCFMEFSENYKDCIIIPPNKVACARISIKKDNSLESFSEFEEKIKKEVQCEYIAEMENKYDDYQIQKDNIKDFNLKIIVEIEGQVCILYKNTLFGELSLLNKIEDENAPKSLKIFKEFCPFVFITCSGMIKRNEPKILYFCINNYYSKKKLNVKISSSSIILCKEDCYVDISESSFNLFEVRAVFRDKIKCGLEDFCLDITADDEIVEYEGIVDIPAVT